jgi:exportin-1
VGQYPRFLKAHWKFLKTVVNKLFEFMHETHEGMSLLLHNNWLLVNVPLTGVQDMACDTFIKIAQKCRRHFVMLQSGEQEPFVDEILRLLHRITVDLSPQQVRSFFSSFHLLLNVGRCIPSTKRLVG